MSRDAMTQNSAVGATKHPTDAINKLDTKAFIVAI